MEPLDKLLNRYWKHEIKKKGKTMPPKITKQTNGPAPKPAPIQEPAQSEHLAIKINVYGRAKSGKTRLCCSFPKPLLLIGTEDGTKSVATKRKPKKHLKDGSLIQALYIGERYLGIDFCRVTASTQVEPLLRLAVEDKYNSVALDHAGGLQDIILKEQMGLTSDATIDKAALYFGGMDTKKLYGAVGQLTNELLYKMLNLTEFHNISAAVIAHEKNRSEGGSSDMVKPDVGAALTPMSARWLDTAVDYICQTYIAQQETVQKVEVGEGQFEEIRTPTGKCEYRLRIGPHAVYNTGFRTIGDELPDYIVNANYDKIVKVIQGEKLP